MRENSGRAFDVQEHKAKYDLAQTTVVAPADGNLALSKGDRATSRSRSSRFSSSTLFNCRDLFAERIPGHPARHAGPVRALEQSGPSHTSTIHKMVSGVGEKQITLSGN
ncbi:hypothetical protein AB4Z51_33350 [Bradyrhizobium sp. 2TAF36]|uniref:hypothetical protein n=1 Tax=Bradyrhizobium sp. 2TAF36 TaxID=3233016 RepID=UPI003F8E616F